MKRKILVILWCAVASSLAVEQAASARPAEPTPAQDAAEKKLITAGDAALAKGDYDAALSLYEDAQKALPSALAPLRLRAVTLARLGRCAEAMPLLDAATARYANPASEENDALTMKKLHAETAAVKRALDAIAAERDQCRARLIAPPTLRVTTTPPGADVRVDQLTGPVAGKTPFETRGVPAGVHKIFVSLDGYRSESRDLDLRAGAVFDQSIPLVAAPIEEKAQPAVVTQIIQQVAPHVRRIDLGVSIGPVDYLTSPPGTKDGLGASVDIVISGGYDLLHTPRFELRVGAAGELAFITESHATSDPPTTDYLLSLLVEPIARLGLLPDRLYLDAGLGIGVTAITNLPDKTVFIPSSSVVTNSRSFGVFAIRPFVALELRLMDWLVIALTAADDYSPAPSGFTVTDFNRFEITLGVGLRL